jgi:radical SAM superfamily enzyme YgiQ (UPF0313 family)
VIDGTLVSERLRSVLLVQLPIPPPGLQPVEGNVPLAAACLKVFAERLGLDEQYRIDLLAPALCNRLGDAGLVAEILAREPWLVGFSCYVWNVERSLWLAARLKQARPDVEIVLGGPEIAADNAWVLEQPCVDWAIAGEGEQAFAELLASPSRRMEHRSVQGDTRMESYSVQEDRRSGTPSYERGRSGAPSYEGVLLPSSPPLASLDEIPSPYRAGVLELGDNGTMVLETVRGCRHRCKFCYYPGSYRTQRFLSPERIAADLAYAAEHGAREVMLLDPTLNQRRDFADFLRLLARGNPGCRFSYSGELRAERLTAAEVQLLAEAGFAEVEIGLQSVDPLAQRLMSRKTNPAAFARGTKMLVEAGIAPRADLIIGLPGDTVASVRRTIDFCRAGIPPALCNRDARTASVQAFHLSILPGTAFRREARRLGLTFQDRPPYYVLSTPTLTLEDMVALMEEAQEAFGVEFDPLPSAVEATSSRLGRFEKSSYEAVRIDLDRELQALPPAAEWAQTFTLHLQSADFHYRRQAAAELVARVLFEAPHTTLQVVIEPTADPRSVTPTALETLRRACFGSVSYLDRYYSLHGGQSRGAKWLIVLLPLAERDRLGPDWRRDVTEYATIVWRGGTLPAEELEREEYVISEEAPREELGSKSEIRSSKSETNPKSEIPITRPRN